MRSCVAALLAALIISAPFAAGENKATAADSAAQAAAKTRVPLLDEALYVTSAETSIAVFQKRKLQRSGKIKPNLAFGAGGFGNQEGVAFDSAGSLWQSFCGIGTGALTEVTQQNLKRLVNRGKTPFNVVITSPNTGIGSPLECPTDMVFDGSGNLWVEVSDGLSLSVNIEGYPSNKLAQSGTAAPASQITPAASAVCVDSGCGARDLTVDAAGNVWLIGYWGPANNEIPEALEYTAAQLAPGGALTLDAALTVQLGPSEGIAIFANVRFDGAGNLWAAFNGDIAMFPAAVLNTSGTIAPAPTVVLSAITADERNFLPATALAFDDAGDLWVSSDAGVAELTPGELLTSGGPTPAAYIVPDRYELNLRVPGLMTFGPRLPH